MRPDSLLRLTLYKSLTYLLLIVTVWTWLQETVCTVGLWNVKLYVVVLYRGEDAESWTSRRGEGETGATRAEYSTW